MLRLTSCIPFAERLEDEECIAGWHPLNSWDDIQKVAKAGVARKYLKVGDLIETTYGSPAVVEVVGINQDTPPGRDRKLSRCNFIPIQGLPSERPILSSSSPLQCGRRTSPLEPTRSSTNTSLPCTFTLTQAVPLGGVIVITSWGELYNPLVIKTMQADRLT